MSATVIGIIVAISMVVCGLGSYFIGRTAGMEWVLEHTMIEVMDDDTEAGEGDTGQDSR